MNLIRVQERKVQEILPPAINADGFGVSWYANEYQSKRDGPCLFVSVMPAWNNRNLHRLCAKLTSPLVFAHIRAASQGSIVSEQNCHPFVVGMYSVLVYKIKEINLTYVYIYIFVTQDSSHLCIMAELAIF